MTVVLQVNGMSCTGCEQRTGREVLAEQVESLGYEVVGEGSGA